MDCYLQCISDYGLAINPWKLVKLFHKETEKLSLENVGSLWLAGRSRCSKCEENQVDYVCRNYV